MLAVYSFIFPQAKETETLPLAGTKWTLDKISDGNGIQQSVKLQRLPTIDFTKDGSVYGFSGVNRFTGTYKTENDRLFWARPLAMTKMMGISEEANKTESMYIAQLGKVYRFYNDGETLSLMDEDGNVLLTFTRTKM
jgi:heat shock protein HslJ